MNYTSSRVKARWSRFNRMKPSKECIDLIKQFEGYHKRLDNGSAAAYLDPVNIPTIGWGTIRYPDGKEVRLGDVRTEAQCTEYLMHEVGGKAAAVEKLVKAPLTQSMFDALVSFAYNVGVGAFQDSTLLRMLNAGNYEAAGQQLLVWNKGGGRVLPGLVRRRDAEMALFFKDGRTPNSAPPQKMWPIVAKVGTYLKKEVLPADQLDKNEKVSVPVGQSYQVVWQSKEADGHIKVSLAYGAGNWFVFAKHWSGLQANAPAPNPAPEQSGRKVLDVPYYSQRDNKTQGSDDWTRTCFSSSCAMLAKFLKPNSITGDDDYISKRRKFGDSTDPSAQVKCLNSLGIKARFVQNLNNTSLKAQIDRGRPVPCGILHKGPAAAPTGGGHWLIVIGYDETGFIVHDPWGEIDHASGTYISTNGKSLHYSYRLFDSRWTVYGASDGWAIVVD